MSTLSIWREKIATCNATNCKYITYTPVEGEDCVGLELEPQHAGKLKGTRSASACVHPELHPEGVVGGSGDAVQQVRHVGGTAGGLRHGAGQSGPGLEQLLDNLLKTFEYIFNLNITSNR